MKRRPNDRFLVCSDKGSLFCFTGRLVQNACARLHRCRRALADRYDPDISAFNIVKHVTAFPFGTRGMVPQYCSTWIQPTTEFGFRVLQNCDAPPLDWTA
jgi:hypothetical protein